MESAVTSFLTLGLLFPQDHQRPPAEQGVDGWVGKWVLADEL